MAGLRTAIEQGKLSDFVKQFYRNMGADAPDLEL